MTAASKAYRPIPVPTRAKRTKKGKIKPAPFKWGPLSKKQVQVMTWWMPHSPVKDRDAIICDGSVRSGKTVSMSFSFVLWAMETFDGQNFGMAGKTIGALRRNVVQPLKRILKARKSFKVKERRSPDNYLEITYKGRTNLFYLFSGKDEGSQELIQGMTLAGMFFDEVALMPQSFVDQATSRCSVTGSKYWFNCNPAGPFHWFKKEWLDNKKKSIFHLHFTMEDNLSLDPKVKERYYRMYSGVFFKRFILGLWVMAEGIVYDMFEEDVHIVDELPDTFDRLFVGGDFGMGNPTTFVLVGQKGPDFYVIREYYHASGQKKGEEEEAVQVRQKTVGQYARDFQRFLGEDRVEVVYLDPSATALIRELRAMGYNNIKAADNTVTDGIQLVQNLLSGHEGRLFVHRSCVNLIREFFSYAWDPKAQARGEDKVIKENDHALDALRYALYNMWHFIRKTRAREQRLRGGRGGTII
jgi:PBSX family phage terminase large subunit